jgi:hypothetical protein
MIQKELFMTRKDGVNLYKTYSDEDFYIIQNETKCKYVAAIDVENASYTYSESDEKIELPEEEREDEE